MSRARLANLIMSTENTIWRIESGRQDPGAMLFAQIVQTIDGKWDDIDWLMSTPDATADDAHRLAQQRLSSSSSSAQTELTDVRQHIIEDMLRDSRFFWGVKTIWLHWFGYEDVRSSAPDTPHDAGRQT